MCSSLGASRGWLGRVVISEKKKNSIIRQLAILFIVFTVTRGSYVESKSASEGNGPGGGL